MVHNERRKDCRMGGRIMLYQNIKALCLINDIKMSYLEELIGRSKGYISSHREKIRFNELLIICNQFGITVQDITEHNYMKDYVKSQTEKQINDYEEEIKRLKGELSKLKGE